jgi:succinate dehydrogenase / fumarate reductase membrane anchor subunit
MNHKSTYSPARSSQHGLNVFEKNAWLFMRISAVLLWVLALGHLYFVHIVNDSGTVDYAFVTGRWRYSFWRGYDWLLLLLGVLHGWNGLRIVVDDVVQSRKYKLIIQNLILASGLCVLVLGTWVLISSPKGM